MPESIPQAREDQFLGALLGLAIGDALGRPVCGMSADEIARTYGRIESYISLEAVEDGRPLQGEISDKSEIVLCLVESLTTNDGRLDPANINARLGFLASGPSRQLMSAATVEGIERASDHDGLVPNDLESEPELAVAVRGVPVGLLHAVGGYDEGTLVVESAGAARLSHGGGRQAQLTADVARVVAVAARTREIPDLAPGPDEHPPREALRQIVDGVRATGTFGSAVSTAIGLGGMTDTMGALAGAFAGAKYGAGGIPQRLIDDLDARIYLTLAAPWFYRAAVRRAGTVIDLRFIE